MPTARSRLAFALLPAAVTLVVIGLALGAGRTLASANGWVDHTRQVIQESDALLLQVTNAETGQRGYLLTGDSAFLEPGRDAKERAEQILSELARLTADNPRQRPRLDTLGRELTAKFTALENGAGLRHTDHLDSLASGTLLREGRQHMERIRNLVAAVNADEQRLLGQRQVAASRQLQIAAAVLLLGGALAVVVAALVNLFLTRIIDERERMSRELGAQLEDLVAVRRELQARSTRER